MNLSSAFQDKNPTQLANGNIDEKNMKWFAYKNFWIPLK